MAWSGVYARAFVLGRWLRVVGAEDAELVAAGRSENESERGGIPTTVASIAARLDGVTRYST
jgi:hypothetical protein